MSRAFVPALPLPATLRFMAAPALLMLGLVAVLYALTSWLVSGQLQAQSRLRVEQRAALFADRLSNVMRANLRALDQLARHPAMQHPERPGAIRAELDWLRKEVPAYVWVGLVAPDGRVVAASRGWLEGAAMASRPVFREALESPYFGDFHPAGALVPLMEHTHLDGELADVGVPIRDAAGRRVAVLTAHLGTGWIGQLARHTFSEAEQKQLGLRWSVMVGHPSRPVGERLPFDPADGAAASGLAVERTREDGQTFLLAAHRLPPIEPIGPRDWYAVAAKDEAIADAPVRQLNLHLGLFAIGSTLVFSALGYLAARRLTRPLDRLLDGIRTRFHADGEPSGRSYAEYLEALADELQAHRPAPGDAEDTLLMARLAAGAQQLRRVIDHLPFGVEMSGSDRRVEFLSQGYTRLLGWTTAQARGLPTASFLLDGEAREQFLAQLRLLDATPGEFVARFDARCADGERRLIQWHLFPLPDGRGCTSGAIALVTDVSAEVSARREADSLSLRLRLLVQASSDHGIVYLDARQRIVGWGHGAASLTRRGEARALGEPFESLFPPEAVREGLPQALLDQARRLGRVDIEAWMRRGASARFFARGTLYRLPPSRDEAHFAILFADSTEAREALERVAASEARLAAIIANASDAIVSTDVEGRVTLFNPAAERIFGLPAARMLGQGLEALLPPETRAGHRKALAAFACSGTGSAPMSNGKIEGLRADGERIALESSIAQATVAGRTELTAILRDVTERVRSERALVQYQVELTGLTQRLLSQEKETTRRLAQVLHDELGQTLAALGLIHAAGLRKQGAQGQEPAPWLRRLEELIAQANRQVRQVLTELRPPLLDEFGLRRALENELQRYSVDEGPAFRLEWEAAPEGLRWPADVEYAAFMIAREACGNALRHARARQVAVRVRGGEAALLLEVEDDGRGAPELDQIVRPGHLGLVGMRERAFAIGATLEMLSQPGKGTTVRLSWGARHG